MKAFFYSSKEAYLKCNGEFLGEVNPNLKTADVPNNSLLEFLPKNPNYVPTYSSEKGGALVKTYPLFNGVFYHIDYEKKRTFPYKILSQNKYKINGDVYALTVLIDGTIKFYIDGNFCVTDELPFMPSSSKLEYLNGYIFAIFYGKTTAIYAYSLKNACLCYKNLVDEFILENHFSTKTIYKNVVEIQVEEMYELGTNFTLINKTAIKNTSAFSVSKNLIPLLFFDLILNGVNASEILSKNLYEKQAELREFIGKVKRVFLNPYCKSEVIALYDNKLSIYELEIKNDTILNIIEKDWAYFLRSIF